ncbi:MAG: DMT family transporter [Deltaproteobacteria bacterium]|nr:DMT family transporter [Deltaproteobacteria bacterium]
MNTLISRYPSSAPESTDHRRAISLLVVCGLFWSTGGLLIKYVDWHPLAIWSTRSAIAGAVLWAVRRPSFRGISRGEWGAAIALAATTGLFIVSNKLTTAANAILIQYSAPVWIALLGAWFLGEKATRLDWVTIGLVLGGITLFFFEQLTLDHVAGNLVALAAGVAFAFSAMTLRRAALSSTVAVPIDPLRALFLGNLLGAVIGAPFVFLDTPPDAHGWLALAGLGIVQQAAAYLCYAWAIRHATALEAMLIPVIEPILSPLWVALAIGERPGSWALVGGAIVVGAVVMRGVLAPARRPQST